MFSSEWLRYRCGILFNRIDKILHSLGDNTSPMTYDLCFGCTQLNGSFVYFFYSLLTHSVLALFVIYRLTLMHWSFCFFSFLLVIGFSYAFDVSFHGCRKKMCYFHANHSSSDIFLIIYHIYKYIYVYSFAIFIRFGSVLV